MTIASDIVLSTPIIPSNYNLNETDFNKLSSQLINNKYPLTEPILNPDGSIKYRIAIVSDLDSASKSPTEPNTWISYFKKGYLTYNSQNNNVTIEWDYKSQEDKFTSHYSYNGRGLELSELVTYNGHLISIDDKTGIVYIIDDDKLRLWPWLLVIEGEGNVNKGKHNNMITIRS